MGKIKGRYQLFDDNGNLVKEKELNGNGLFYMLMDPDDQDPDTECISAGLLGAADIEDFIENVTEIVADTLEQIAKMKKRIRSTVPVSLPGQIYGRGDRKTCLRSR